MPSSARPKASAGGARTSLNAPMSERQQMALLMQMTSLSQPGSRSPSGSRARDRNERGETPLHLAAIKGDVEQVGKLLAQRADPNATDFAGWTPLHEACNHGWYEVALRLVQAGASVNARGLDDDTPLHDAASNGHAKLARLLVEHGADIHARNKKGKTPCDIAAVAVLPFLNAESSAGQRVQSRPRDEKKVSADPGKKSSTPMDGVEQSQQQPPQSTSKTPLPTTAAQDDVYEFKSTAKEPNTASETKAAEAEVHLIEASDQVNAATAAQGQVEDAGSGGTAAVVKRTFGEVAEGEDPVQEDDGKRKKRKDSDGAKDGKAGTQTVRNANQTVKATKSSSLTATKQNTDRKSPCPNTSLKPPVDEQDDTKSDLKVPPLKIVIPQSSTANEQESSTRNGKSSSQRAHQALPYVVASSNSSDSASGTTTVVTVATASQEDSTTVTSNVGTVEGAGNAANTQVPAKGEEKKDASGTSGSVTDDQKSSSGSHHQRVLRSSHRTGSANSTATTAANSGSTVDRGSNNSSPLLQRSHSPSPSSSPAVTQPSTTSTPSESKETVTTTTASGPTNQSTTSTTSTTKTTVTSDVQQQASTSTDAETSSAASATTLLPQSTGGNTSNGSSSGNSAVELHPRKRKMRPSKEAPAVTAQPLHHEGNGSGSSSGGDAGNAVSEVHPHEQPITNCYQLYLNIRRQIERRRKSLFPVQPKPPQGFKDYLMNRCTYVLAGTAPTVPNVAPPASLPSTMRELFTEQEKERYKLRMQHVIEKEKLVLSVEQEILRVHGRAARALANQSLPFSVCTVLRDEEVYNIITPEQEELDRNARSRYNGRLFLSWLQDVDDKWEKIKEHMLLRHHNEAESLHAVQRMDWEWKLKEFSLCEYKVTPHIDEMHVPMVHVSDDFDLLPA